MESGELIDPEKIKVDDSLKFTTPEGKIVYGGGGIIPDVFVPIDGSMQNETLSYLQRRGYFGNFVFGELERDRHAYDDFERQDFIDSFEVGEDLVYAFQDYLNLRSDSKVTFVAYHDEVKQYIKATLADQLFGGRAAPLIAHLAEKRGLTTEDIKELEALLKELKSDRS